jgi:hypothetical protein
MYLKFGALLFQLQATFTNDILWEVRKGVLQTPVMLKDKVDTGAEKG